MLVSTAMDGILPILQQHYYLGALPDIEDCLPSAWIF